MFVDRTTTHICSRWITLNCVYVCALLWPYHCVFASCQELHSILLEISVQLWGLCEMTSKSLDIELNLIKSNSICYIVTGYSMLVYIRRRRSEFP
jgi:hypothetical protein